MKNFLGLLILFTLLMCSSPINSQTREEVRSNKNITKNASKEAKKEAKRLEKEGWKPGPGTRPIESQEYNNYLMQEEYEGDLPKYVFGSAQTIGANYDAAKLQAMTLAKQNLITQLETQMGGLISNEVSNSQLDEEDAASIVTSISQSKEIMDKKIGRVTTVLEIYREVNGKKKEVQVVIAYSMDTAKKLYKEAVIADLQKKGLELKEEVDKLFEW